MAYLEEFHKKIEDKDFPKLMQIWEEYSNDDQVDSDEFIKILKLLLESEMAQSFGRYVETALPLWSKIEDDEASHAVLRLILDLQTTDDPALGELAYKDLEKRYSDQKNFKQKIRIIGLRNMEGFQGAIRNYELLSHMNVGKFVFHTGGWGTGEIVDISLVREHVVTEFENVNGRRDLTFKNAFKTLVALDNAHFLARRFGDPDSLEADAKKDHLEMIHLLLHDLGPKTAAEIKDELSGWVIPDEEWTKWWQTARAKIKKDTKISTPKHVHKTFILREEEMPHEERLKKELQGKISVQRIIQITYNYVRDFPNLLKKKELKKALQEQLQGHLEDEKISDAERLQLAIFLENQLSCELEKHSVKEQIRSVESAEVINAMEVLAFQKRALVAIRKYREDWVKLFLSLFHKVDQNPLRDYMLRELNHEETKSVLEETLQELWQHPERHPQTFVWYFQKILSKEGIYHSDADGQKRFLESFLILFHKLEVQRVHKDLRKKMYSLLTSSRYAVVRKILKGSSIDYLREYLLLISKCQTLSDHDVKILHSLAEVVQPSLKKKKEKSSVFDDHVIWTTEEGHKKLEEKIESLQTEIIENRKEVQAAKALGDLRENFEYKAAKERQAQLQNELKSLGEQAKKARVISKEDVSEKEVGIGVKIDIEDEKGSLIVYTILGPWDAVPEEYILSFQSEKAKAMIGRKSGDTFTFRDEKYMIKKIKSIFES